MALRPAQFDEFDDLLMEAFEAEQVGVFGPTQVDVERLMAAPVSPVRPRIYRYLLAGLPVAASLALFLGVASVWKSGHRSGGSPLDVSGPYSSGDGNVIEQCQTMENLKACFSGPGVRARLDCACVDLDADGDVDLRDTGLLLQESGQ